jgi:hypothetical protein
VHEETFVFFDCSSEVSVNEHVDGAARHVNEGMFGGNKAAFVSVFVFESFENFLSMQY